MIVSRTNWIPDGNFIIFSIGVVNDQGQIVPLTIKQEFDGQNSNTGPGGRPLRGPAFFDGFPPRPPTPTQPGPPLPRLPSRLAAPITSPGLPPPPPRPTVASLNNNNLNNNNINNNPAAGTTTRQPRPLFQFLPQLPDFSQLFGL